jgi:peptidoglycan/xylan/chitin deacetylase (PgdA/CDA1 family)
MNAVKNAIKGALASGAGWRLSRPLRPAGVVVVTYHRVGPPGEPLPGLGPAVFREEMEWLKAHCRLLAPEELRAAAAEERERPAVLVTFDDGYRGFHDHAWPVLKALAIPSVVFLSTRFMDEGGMLWADRLYLAVTRTERRTLRTPWGDEVALTGAGDRRAFLKAVKARLKELPDARKQEEQAALLHALGPYGEAEIPREMLSWDEVRSCSGLTRFGGHTHSHPILSRLTPEVRADEIRTCRDRIAAELRVVPTLFAYPNGRAVDFDAATQGDLRAHGFDTAFTTIEGVNGPATDWMAVRRVGGGGGLPEFAWQVSGLWARRASA